MELRIISAMSNFLELFVMSISSLNKANVTILRVKNIMQVMEIATVKDNATI